MGVQGRWEYTTIHVGTNQQTDTNRILNELGSVGWELVGWAGTDKTIGFNALVGVFRRPLADLPAPDDATPGWKPDLFDPTRYRWWDGGRWIEVIHNDKGDGRSFPVGFPQINES